MRKNLYLFLMLTTLGSLMIARSRHGGGHNSGHHRGGGHHIKTHSGHKGYHHRGYHHRGYNHPRYYGSSWGYAPYGYGLGFGFGGPYWWYGPGYYGGIYLNNYLGWTLTNGYLQNRSTNEKHEYSKSAQRSTIRDLLKSARKELRQLNKELDELRKSDHEDSITVKSKKKEIEDHKTRIRKLEDKLSSI